MRKAVKFMRPFLYIKDDEPDGIHTFALVILRRRPFEVIQGPHPDPAEAERGTMRVHIAKYEYFLFMDLWVAKLNLNWIGRDDAKAKELRAWQARKHLDTRQAAEDGSPNRQPE